MSVTVTSKDIENCVFNEVCFPKTDTGYAEKHCSEDQISEFIELILPHSGKGRWVHFRSDEAVRISESSSNWLMPRGLYALEADQVLAMAVGYRDSLVRSRRQDVQYRFKTVGYSRRPFVAVVEPLGSYFRGWEIGKAEFDAAVERVNDHCETQFGKRFGIVDNLKRTASINQNTALRGYLYCLENMCNGLISKNAILVEDFLIHPLKPEIWSDLIRASGFVGIEDRHSHLTGEFGHQMVAVDETAYSVIAVHRNPAAADAVPQAQLYAM